MSNIREVSVKDTVVLIHFFRLLKGWRNGFVMVPLISWLVGCFRFNGPLRQYFSLYRAVSQREGEGNEKL